MQKELSSRAVCIGLALALIMAAANVYLGLKVGMTVSASIPAAVLSMMVLKYLFGEASILEANQAQTAASAGESLAAGIIFTLPALVIVGVWQDFSWTLTTLISFTGGLLGVLLMIPMRKIFIAPEKESDRDQNLIFPEAVACAAVLRAGKEKGTNSGSGDLVLEGAIFGCIFKAAVDFLGIIKGTLESAWLVGKALFYFGGDMSVALLGVGIIVRFNVAALVFCGGVIGWVLALPALSISVTSAGGLVERAYLLWSEHIRYIGVGAMVIGGFVALGEVRGHIYRVVSTLFKNTTARGRRTSKDFSHPDIAGAWVISLTLLCIVLVACVYFHLTANFEVTLLATFLMLASAFFFTAVACHTVGLVGNSNSPVSGMTITAVLISGMFLVLAGFTGTTGLMASLGIAAIVCCTACTAGDICNDLKTGHLVGASPKKQQIMQVAGVAVAAVILAPTLQMLQDFTPGGIGGPELPAPQARLFASIARAFFSDQKLPWNLLATGATIAVVLVAVGRLLKKHRPTFKVYIMPIAVGMYLPLGLSVPIFIGGVLALFRSANRKSATDRLTADPAVLFASGLIAGEALTGLAIAFLASQGISRHDIGLSDWLQTTLTLAAGAAAIGFAHLRICGSWQNKEDAAS